MVGAAIGGLAGFFFSHDEVEDYHAAKATFADAHTRFFRGLLAHGVYFPPSRFEALFLSTEHTEEHIDRVVGVAAHVLTSR